MTLIIGVSGKKNSGKDSVGKAFSEMYNKYGKNSCGIYHYADKLKEFCRDYLGIDELLLWGDNDAKNTLVAHILWEKMPDYDLWVQNAVYQFEVDCVIKNVEFERSKILDTMLDRYKGPMSVREILQYFGTNIMRKIMSNIWVHACLRQIEKDGPRIALILDERFPSEADFVKQKGGYNIRLTRTIFPDDTHESEIALDNYKFDFVIDNSKISLKETCSTFNNLILSLASKQ